MSQVLGCLLVVVVCFINGELLAEDCRDYTPTVPIEASHYLPNQDAILYEGYLLVLLEGAEGGEVSVFDPGAPEDFACMASCPVPGYPGDRLLVEGNLVSSLGYGYVHVMDFLDPLAPRYLCRWDLGDESLDLCLRGDLLYVAGNWQSLRVYDVSTFTDPVLQNDILVPGEYVQNVTLLNDHLLVGTREDIIVYDLDDPVHPALVTAVPSSLEGWMLSRLVVRGDWLVAVHRPGLAVFDISQVVPPLLVSTFSDPIGMHFSFDWVGDRALVCDPDGGTHLLDLSAMPQIQHLLNIPCSGSPYKALLNWNQAVVRDHNDLIQFLDLGAFAPVDPVVTSSYMQDHYWDLTICGPYIMGVDTWGNQRGLRTLQMEPDGQVTQVASLDLAGSYFEVQRTRLAMAGYGSGLRFVDVADPAEPEHLFDFSLPGSCQNLSWWGDTIYAYVEVTKDDGREYRIFMVDVADPDAPQVVASSPDLGMDVEHLLAHERGVFVILESGEVRAVRMTAARPAWGTTQEYRELDHMRFTSAFPRSSFLAGDRLFLAVWGRVIILDVSDPGNMQLVCDYRLPVYGGVGYCTLHGNILYCMVYPGVLALDVSDQAHPQPVGFLPLESFSPSLVCSDDFLYAENQDNGMTTCYLACDGDAWENWGDLPVGGAEEKSAPAATAFERIYPQPANPRVRIEFVLDGDAPGRLELFDVAGRLVRSWDVASGPRRGSVNWDGTDSGGRSVASGTYLARLRAGDAVETRRLVLVRCKRSISAVS